MNTMIRIIALAALGFAGCSPALAQIAVHPVILDLPPGELQRADFTVENPTSERVFVAVEPARIDAPGSAAENRVAASDPQTLGLLASPPRIILEPGERRFVRVAALTPPGETERVFRVAVKPVAGEVTGEASGLKVLVGYDLLVIQRPAVPSATLDWEDRGDKLVIRNTGNSNIQLVNGRACNKGQQPDECAEMPPARLYAGNEMVVAKQAGQAVTYDLIFMGRSTRQVFKR
jgi:Mat/Ecp fimbriae periplasmic chaperone